MSVSIKGGHNQRNSIIRQRFNVSNLPIIVHRSTLEAALRVLTSRIFGRQILKQCQMSDLIFKMLFLTLSIYSISKCKSLLSNENKKMSSVYHPINKNKNEGQQNITLSKVIACKRNELRN
jgi:hypothetical protein